MAQTTNKTFGLADPQYDALRVLSTQALQIGSIDNTITSGGGLENKIYLWPADGSTITTYDATQAGLIAALAAATTGDTVWLPSIPIALTTGVTIPASVALRGISHNAILTFSGFSGTAVTLSAGSLAETFTMTFTSNGDTAIGIAAGVVDAVIDDIDVHVEGGTATNIAIDLGVAIIVDEIWIAGTNAEGANPFVAWSNYTRSGTRIWNTVSSLPAGVPTEFVAADDGSAVYLGVTTIAPGETDKIYKSTNPKDASPTWTEIAGVGLDTGIGTITTYFSYVMGPMTIQGTTLATTANVGTHEWVYGEYNGSAWSWTSQSNANIFSPGDAGFDTWLDQDYHIYDKNHTLIETMPGAAVQRSGIWHRSGQARYVSVGAAPNLNIRIVGTSNIAIGAYSTNSQITTTHIRGAHQGVQIYCVADANGAENGHLWLSDNGTTFSDLVAWGAGWVEDDVIGGGGNLIWILREIAASGTVGRQYDRTGSILDDLTGNFWSVISPDSLELVGMGIVYV